MRLKERIVLITGAGRGIGKGIARRLAREGATIVVADRDEGTAEATSVELRAGFGIQSSHLCVNVGYEDQVRAMVEHVGAEYGRLDVLVNNAQGFNGVAPVAEKTTGEFDYSLRTGLYASLWAMQAAFPMMRDQGGGSVINLVSLDGVIGKPMLSDYDVAKESIRALSKVAAREWGRYQIRVNCLAPSAVTEVYERSSKQWPGFADAIIQATPLGRVGDCEDDIGGVALFLASDDSRYLTGMTLFADGGLFLAPPSVPVVTDPSIPRPERKVQWITER